MLDFTLTEEETQIQDTVRSFVTREVMPYERVLIEREVDGGNGASPGLSDDERRDLWARAKAMGLWGIDTPEEYGGADLSPVAQHGIGKLAF